MRWRYLICCISLLFCCFANADIMPVGVLSQAQQLLEIDTPQAQKIARDYLTQRKLSARKEQNASALSREEADQNLRTPSSSVKAYMIIANAEFAQGQPTQAFISLQMAKKLAQTYELPYLLFDIQLVKTRLQWLKDKDTQSALHTLEQIKEQVKNNKQLLPLTTTIHYQLLMFHAELAASLNNYPAAEADYKKARALINSTNSDSMNINYHLTVGEYYLKHQKFNHALSELLFGYWKSIGSNQSVSLAKANRLLADLFQQRRVLDKALQHLSQAADFYDSYPNSPLLASVLQQMGDIYYSQGKYNLALVHYFNVLDHDSTAVNPAQIITIRLNLAATYLQLYNYPLTEQYLSRAQDLLNKVNQPRLNIEAVLLKAGLAYHQGDSIHTIENARQALLLLDKFHITDTSASLRAYHLLSRGYELSGDYPNALVNLKKYNVLTQNQQQKLNQISEDAFRQQKEFAEQTLHYMGQETRLKTAEANYKKFQTIAFVLFLITLILFLFVLRRGVLLQRQGDEIEKLNNDLYTHSRSKLSNLRMLNAKLSNSLLKATETFEQWQMGDLIHEPLNDRLRFVMIDLPFLRSMYLEHGYKTGLELERAFGSFLTGKMEPPSRIYHFSDANLLYIEPNPDRETSAEQTFSKVQSWISEFANEHRLSDTIRVGIADYPFLPRAYTAINDQELLDLLLLAAHIAREVSLEEKTSQWVYLKAIQNAPAASFADENIRKACRIAIRQGLVKVHTSCNNEACIKNILKNDE